MSEKDKEPAEKTLYEITIEQYNCIVNKYKAAKDLPWDDPDFDNKSLDIKDINDEHRKFFEAEDEDFEACLEEIKNPSNKRKFPVKPIIGICMLVAIAGLGFLSYNFFPAGKIKDFFIKESSGDAQTTTTPQVNVTVFAMDGERKQFIDAEIIHLSGTREVVYPETGYTGWFECDHPIQLRSPGYQWAEEKYDFNEDKIQDDLKNKKGMVSCSLKWKDNDNIVSDDNGKNVVGVFIGFKKNVQIKMLDTIPCKLTITSQNFDKEKKEFEFNDTKGYEGYWDLQRSQDYEYELIPKDPEYMKMSKPFRYDGEPQLDIRVYKDYLAIYNKSGVLPNLDEIADDHPQKEELKRLSDAE